MKNTLMKSGLLLIVCILTTITATSCKEKNIASVDDDRISVIFETDMGNDVDDALALDLLYKYLDDEAIDLLAVMSNKNSVYSAEYIDIMNTWYGYPNIPIGIMEGGPNSENDAVNYVKAVCLLEKDGKPMFARSVADHKALPQAKDLYRKLLSQQPDNSVVIISVGFSTNLIRLLDSQPDDYSSLNGRELVAKKVKYLSCMMGSFSENKIKEYNVVVDIPAAKKLMSEWPTNIMVSPFEVGIAINYPATSIENDFSWAPEHPMVEAYKAYLPMPYDRPTWDLTNVLNEIEPDRKDFIHSEKGTISVDDEGYTHFEPSAKGKHVYLSVTPEKAEMIKQYFIDKISSKPKKRK